MNDDLLNDKLDRHEKKIEEFDNRLDSLKQQRIKIEVKMDNICEKLDRVADCLSEDKKLKYSYMVTIFIFIIEQFVSTFIK